MPPRQPAYRATRAHTDFLTNIPVAPADLRAALAAAFSANAPLPKWPDEHTAQLASSRYSQSAWNLQR